jgi:hypothetical protein
MAVLASAGRTAYERQANSKRIQSAFKLAARMVGDGGSL